MNRKFIIAAAGTVLIGLGALVFSGQWSGNEAIAANSIGGDKSWEKSEIESVIHDYLMDNPEVILDAVNKLQQREQNKAEQAAQTFLQKNRGVIESADAGAFIAGNPEGDVTIVEFFDYHCGFCKKSLVGLMKTVEKDKNIKLVLREFPVLGPESKFAAKAAMAAIEQGKYMELHLEMMEAKGKLTRSRIENMVVTVGMDLIVFNKAVSNPEYEKVLAANMDLARGLNINGTPSFVLGDGIHHGMRSGDELRTLVAEARSS